MSTISSKIVRKQCLHACDFFHVCPMLTQKEKIGRDNKPNQIQTVAIQNFFVLFIDYVETMTDVLLTELTSGEV